MAISPLDCGMGSTLTLTNNSGATWSFFLADVNPPDRFHKLAVDGYIQFPCTGVVYLDDQGVGAVGAGLLPIPHFPYEQGLLGLAGLLSGFLFASIISRLGRGKGGT